MDKEGPVGSEALLKRGATVRGQQSAYLDGTEIKWSSLKGELEVAAFVSFHVAVVKCPDRIKLRERRLILISQFKGTVHHNGGVKGAGI